MLMLLLLKLLRWRINWNWSGVWWPFGDAWLSLRHSRSAQPPTETTIGPSSHERQHMIQVFNESANSLFLFFFFFYLNISCRNKLHKKYKNKLFNLIFIWISYTILFILSYFCYFFMKILFFYREFDYYVLRNFIIQS